MLFIPTYEENKAAKAERQEVIEAIMEIQDAKKIHKLAVKARRWAAEESEKRPMLLSDFVSILDPAMIARLRDLFKDESSEYVANAQIKELLEKEWERNLKVQETMK